MVVRAGGRAGGGHRRALAALTGLLVVLTTAAGVPSAAPAAAAVPAGFSEVVAFRGLVEPTAVRFAPDGRVFVAEKRGTIVMFDGLADTTPTRVADLRTEVHNFWDRGLLGLAVDPDFPAEPHLYALYTYDGGPGQTAPRWGTAGADSDPCPSPPGANGDGCVVTGKLVRLTLDGTTTTKRDLVRDWCQQYPSHTVGDVVFGRDGSLYVSGGDGASFGFVDYGQDGNPLNPCGDPPGGVGARLTPPTAQGGALRSQDLRTAGDPVGLAGTVIRVYPVTGAALPDNPNAAAADPNARRIVAQGLRNPFRMTARPGTGEIWLGNVGWGSFEEVNRLPAPMTTVRNFGWPCYEGSARQAGYDAANLSICENLYASAGAHAPPYSSYPHRQPASAADTCRSDAGSSLSGLAFHPGGAYPEEYRGALFVSDFSRSCIWVVPAGADGLPDRSRWRTFVSGAAGPVDLEVSPAGELYYVDLVGGTIRRIVHQGSGPTSCLPGQYLAQYYDDPALSGAPTTTACEAAPLDRRFGLSAPAGVGPDSFSARWSGTFSFPAEDDYTFTAVADDGTRVRVDGVLVLDEWRTQPAGTFTATRRLTAGQHVVEVEWFDDTGEARAGLSWTAGAAGAPPQPRIDTPAEGTTWRVGDVVTFSGTATDAEDGDLPASRLVWNAILRHCPADCHDHSIGRWAGTAGGSVTVPDHEYPAHLELRLTATDAGGQATTVTRRLDPRTSTLTLATLPAGLDVALGQRTATAPLAGTLIVGGSTSVSAPSPQTLGGGSYRFQSWSDGGTQSHNVTAGTTGRTLTARFAAASCPAGRYRAQYFPNRTLSGAASSTVCETAPLTRDWGFGAPPGAGVRADDFSVRWWGMFRFPDGTRTFTATSDDGMRVWLDDVLIVDRWTSSGTTQVTRAVSAGDHAIRVQYWEGTGTAKASLTW